MPPIRRINSGTSELSEDNIGEGNLYKKRTITGRMSDVMKKMRLQTHEEGKACTCKRLKCYENTTTQERSTVLQNFNALSTHNAQNLYLCGLINIIPVQRHRSRKPEQDANFHEASFSYKLRIHRNDSSQDVPVCSQAFRAVHGISKGKLEYLQKSLKEMGVAPEDKRGIHSTKHRKLKQEYFEAIQEHIKSFRARASHYSLHDSKRKYLPEDLNITKMFKMFQEKYSTIKISYQSYKKVFNTKFNLSFGYPRTDTCSACDKFYATLRTLSADTDAAEIRELTVKNELHKRKAQSFYNKKKNARLEGKREPDRLSIAMDFQKNISLPKVSTNDVYYRRQLSVFSFNIHILHSGESIFYTYPETVSKKGPNEVVSFLVHFLYNYVSDTVKHLHIFCDGAGGQNKNFILFRFMHYVVHEMKKLNSIQVTFPERGHSYLECDRNMGNINLKTKIETPDDWYELIKASRTKPSPFSVEEVTQTMVMDWTSFLRDLYYAKKCPFPVQKTKEVLCKTSHCRFLLHRSSYNGVWNQAIVRGKGRKETRLLPNEFELPKTLYQGKQTFFFNDA